MEGRFDALELALEELRRSRRRVIVEQLSKHRISPSFKFNSSISGGIEFSIHKFDYLAMHISSSQIKERNRANDKILFWNVAPRKMDSSLKGKIFIFAKAILGTSSDERAITSKSCPKLAIELRRFPHQKIRLNFLRTAFKSISLVLLGLLAKLHAHWLRTGVDDCGKLQGRMRTPTIFTAKILLLKIMQILRGIEIKAVIRLWIDKLALRCTAVTILSIVPQIHTRFA
ncbi:hypothetical protein Tco_0077548 [Tanacetum coccineum]